MNDIAEQRPDFFEGEYLGADDLQQLVIYLRDQSARHALGGHAWGIAAGLDLVEQPAPSGTGVDVYLLPGHAVDGYGRAVVVINPVRLTVDLFAGLPSGSVPLWLRYDEAGTRGVRPGFEVCAASDAYARIAESYVLEAGVLALSKRQSGISVAGEPVADAREALRVFDDSGAIACDGSVPYQDLPLGDEKLRWLIPLGLVGWTAGTPGTLVKLGDAERLRSRRQRRYLGVIAENVLAADGLIRLRRRTTPVVNDPATGLPVATEDLCAADDVAAPAHDQDLKLCNARPAFNELVWVEGRLRVTDDTRLLGGRLEFRNAAGTDYLPENQPGSPALLFQRVDNGKNADLELLLGTAKTGRNNFVIADAGKPAVATVTQNGVEVPDPCAALRFSPTPRVTVQDDGKVAIGPSAPDEMLTVEASERAFVHVKTTSGHHLYAGASQDGAVVAALNTDDLRLRTGGPDPSGGPDATTDAFARITIKPQGQVGIGTTRPDPDRLVTLETRAASYLIARTTDEPHEVLLGASAGGASLMANTVKDDLVLGANGGEPKLWIKSTGQIGVGTSAPGRDVTVAGRSTNTYLNLRSTDGREILLGADWTGTMVSAISSDDLQLRAGGNVNCVTIKANRNVGVGTDGPVERLDVRGNIKLGAGDLFAAGSPDNLRILAGNVSATGGVTAGSGFSVTRLSMGQFRINLGTPYAAPPVVVATIVDPSNDDNIATVRAVSSGSFEIHVVDVVGNAGNVVDYQDESFSFVAFGLR